MRCPKCRKDFDTRFCPNCGYSPETAEGITPPRAPEPPPFDDNQPSQPQGGWQPPTYIINNNIPPAYNTSLSIRSKWVAFFLCLLMGIFGAHRFYVGKIGTGILYLITWGGLGIGVFIDLVVILLGSFTDKGGRFLS